MFGFWLLSSSSSSLFLFVVRLLYREREYAYSNGYRPFRVWLSWGPSSRCPNQSSVCIVLSDVVELAKMAELCCCGDEVICCILPSYFFLFFSYCSTEPRILFLLCRLVWCAGHFFFIYFFVDVVCPLSLSHLPHTFILRIPFIQTLCSGRSFRSFLSFSVLCLLASFRCPLQLTSRKS